MPDLDPVIHVVARLRITAALAALDRGDSLSFPRLQSLLDLTAGNLITHLRKLEEAGYVQVDKLGSGRNAQTLVSLTDRGRDAFAQYTNTLREMLEPSARTDT
jgi:DNA-binding MarR family transcriptional regulator